MMRMKKKIIFLTATFFLQVLSRGLFSAPGDLDTGFGIGGKVRTNFSAGGTDDFLKKMVLQNDGKIVAVGGLRVRSTNNAAVIVRYTPEGYLDNSFGSERNGKILLTPDAVVSESTFFSVAIQENGRIVTAGHFVSGFGRDFVIFRYDVNGTPDTSFGVSGRVVENVGDYDESPSITLQSDRKIVLTGKTDDDIALLRYLENGSLDTSFGPDRNGIVHTSLGGAYRASPRSVYTQPSDNKIVVIGQATNLSLPTGSDYFIVRYNSDGTLDTSFGADRSGKVIVNVQGPGDECQGGLLQNDGKIIMYGRADFSGTRDDLTLLRYNADGTPDTSFGSSGVAHFDVGSLNEMAHQVASDREGNIFVVGNSENNSVLLKLNSTGSLDTSFATRGVFTMNYGDRVASSTSYDVGNSLLLTTGGRIIVGNTTQPGTSRLVPGDLMFFQVSATGSLDTSGFAPPTSGLVLTDLENPLDITHDQVNGLTINGSGKIIAVGVSSVFGAITQYNRDGSLDTSFGRSGKLVNLESGREGSFLDVGLQSSGDIIVAGEGHVAGLSTDFYLSRYSPSGVLDTTFGNTAGRDIRDLSGANLNDVINDIHVQSDDKIVAVGTTYGDFAIARYTSGGILDSSFSPLIVDMGAGTPFGSSTTDNAYGVVLDAGNNVYVVGSTSSARDPNDFSVLKVSQSGTVDTSFGSSGKVFTSFSSGSTDIARSVVLENDGSLLVAGTSNQDFAMVKYDSSGVLDNRFGDAGKVITPIGTSTNDEANKILLQSDHKIIVLGRSNDDFAAVRYNVDGSLDSTFGSAGKVVMGYSTGSFDYAHAGALQSDGKIILAGQTAASTTPAQVDFALMRFEGVAPTLNADIAVSQSLATTPVVQNRNFTLTVTVTNHGPDTSGGINLTTTFPAGVTLVSVTPSPPGATCSGTVTVTCGLGVLSNGSSATVTFLLNSPTPGSYRSEMNISSSGSVDSVTSNNTSALDITVTAAAGDAGVSGSGAGGVSGVGGDAGVSGSGAGGVSGVSGDAGVSGSGAGGVSGVSGDAGVSGDIGSSGASGSDSEEELGGITGSGGSLGGGAGTPGGSAGTSGGVSGSVGGSGGATSASGGVGGSATAPAESEDSGGGCSLNE